MADSRTNTRRSSNKRRANKSRLGLFTAAILILLFAGYLIALEISRPHVKGDRLRIDTFADLVEQGRVKDAKILDQDSYVVGSYVLPDSSSGDSTGRGGGVPLGGADSSSGGLGSSGAAPAPVDGPTRTYNTPYVRDYQTQILDFLVKNRVPTTVDQQVGKKVGTLVTTWVPGIALVVMAIYVVTSHRRGTGIFSIKSGAKKIETEDVRVSFADVAGQDAAVMELREIKEFLIDPQRFSALGAIVPKGVLLYGPPGCGKTMLAKALAGEAGASFYSISGSDFVEVYQGVGASRVRDLFREARDHAPALVFIDELDSVGGRRGALNADSEQEHALNQILAEMDGFGTSDNVIVIGATNRPDVLDPALLRPGRFDRTIALESPNEEARLAILNVHARNRVLAPEVDLAAVASRAHGLTGADLATIVNDGALLAARAGRNSVSQADLIAAMKQVQHAPDRQRRLSLRGRSIGKRLSPDDKATFADVAGQDEAVRELREIKDYLVDPERYTALGAAVPKGILLYGPPGCGKTLLAKALANEANAAFLSVVGSEFIEVLVGEGASRVRDLFAEARATPPAIVFIDELDVIGGTRTSDESEQGQLTQILAEMDGFVPAAGVIVLGATNRPDALDPALLRPGRFDRTIGLELPDEDGRAAVLAAHAKEKRLAFGVDLAAIASITYGLTGADLANIMNEAALLAGRADKEYVEQADIEESVRRIMSAPERQRRLSLRARSVGRRYTADERVTFADIAGVDDAITELIDVKDYLANPDRFVELGARGPRGILLSGPPGCGKTLLARAVAGEANAAFIFASASEFSGSLVGQGAARIRDLFAEARAVAPAIVFIDELDSVGGQRGIDLGRERDQTLNQFLVELDGFEGRTGVTVMGATNRADMLDPALVRSGRFDRQVEIRLPDKAGRHAILELHLRKKMVTGEIDVATLAGLTAGLSGADLESIANEAALLASRSSVGGITQELLEEGIDRVIFGMSSRGMLMTPEEKRVIAYHEAGHALVAATLPNAKPPYKVTIVPRGGALGRCKPLDDHDRYVVNRSTLLDEMAVYLGGLTAEELVFDDVGSGARSDLARVGSIARAMVRDYGMSKNLGPLGYPDQSSTDGLPRPTYSEASAQAIDEEVRALVDQASERCRHVLESRRPVLDRLAEALLDKETIDAEEIGLITGTVRKVEPKAGNGARKRRPRAVAAEKASGPPAT